MITDIELLENMSKQDKYLDHNIEECGQCYFQYIMAQVAKEMLEKGDTNGDVSKRWHDELHKRWEESKYYQLWIAEIKEKRDPHKAFEERGWTP